MTGFKSRLQEELDGVENAHWPMVERLRRLAFVLIEFIVCLSIVNVAGATEGYPLREEYSDINIISTEDLQTRYNDVMIVDVRSKMEFDVVHIKKAIHVPIGSRNFESTLKTERDTFERHLRNKRNRKFRSDSADKEKESRDDKFSIIFYCKGHSCAKSYQATRKAHESGFQNILCYDSGVFDWVIANPKLSVLMGTPPSGRNKIITESEYQSRLVSLEEFQDKSRSSDVTVVDIRDPFQRIDNIGPDVKGIIQSPIDQMVKWVEAKKYQDKELLLFDAVGKQVRWLHYYLKKYGYTRYSFLKGGVGRQ